MLGFTGCSRAPKSQEREPDLEQYADKRERIVAPAIELLDRLVAAQSAFVTHKRDVSIEVGFVRVSRDGLRTSIARPVAAETPVAIELNGLGYAVLMATPADLLDLVTGFLLTEQLIENVSDIVDAEETLIGAGRLMRVTLRPERLANVVQRVRHRTADSSCGLCGVESLEQALRPLPRVAEHSAADDTALFRALDAITEYQTLNRKTGAVHAAALCDRDGAVELVREDVGRHNAFDKLIGAMRRAGKDWVGGFALLTSRCSYELVQKAALAGCPMLATVSAPTSLAVDRAAATHVQLRVLARADAFLQPAEP